MLSLRASPMSVVDSRRAWLAAIGVAIANGIAFGTVYTFGTFFEAMADEFSAARGSTAVIFALTLLLFFGFGVVSGPLSDRVGPLPALAAGSGFFLAGLVLTSVVDALWVGYLTYALIGLGGGCFIAPLTGAAGALFERRRAAALGVVAAGNGLGTMLLIPFAEWLIDNHGWRVALRGLAVVAAVGYAVAALLVVRPPARAPGARGEGETTRQIASHPNFVRLFVGAVLMSVSLFTSFAYIVPFATDNGVASSTAARLMSLVGLSSIFGRLALTGLAARLGALRLMQLTILVQPVVYVIWLLGNESVVALAVFALSLGVVYGGFVAISPEVAIVLFGAANVGRLMGLLFLSFGIGGLLGPPLAGWLADGAGQRPVIVAVILIVAASAAVMMTIAPDERDQAAEAAPTVGATAVAGS